MIAGLPFLKFWFITPKKINSKFKIIRRVLTQYSQGYSVDYFHQTTIPTAYNSMHLKIKILSIYCFEYIYQRGDLWCYSWLKHCATRWKVIGVISSELTGFFPGGTPT
jgi:hypothetical protein